MWEIQVKSIIYTGQNERPLCKHSQNLSSDPAMDHSLGAQSFYLTYPGYSSLIYKILNVNPSLHSLNIVTKMEWNFTNESDEKFLSDKIQYPELSVYAPTCISQNWRNRIDKMCVNISIHIHTHMHPRVHTLSLSLWGSRDGEGKGLLKIRLCLRGDLSQIPYLGDWDQAFQHLGYPAIFHPKTFLLVFVGLPRFKDMPLPPKRVGWKQRIKRDLFLRKRSWDCEGLVNPKLSWLDGRAETQERPAIEFKGNLLAEILLSQRRSVFVLLNS